MDADSPFAVGKPPIPPNVATDKLDWAMMGTPDPNQVTHICKKFTDTGWVVLAIIPAPMMTQQAILAANPTPALVFFVYAYRPESLRESTDPDVMRKHLMGLES